MRDYFLRRLLLVPVTLFGITFLIFSMTRFLPGGPVEKALERNAMGAEGQKTGANRASGSSLSQDQLDQIKAQYLLDRPLPIAYLTWLGVIRREIDRQALAFDPGESEKEVTLTSYDPATARFVTVFALARKSGPTSFELVAKEPANAIPEGWFIRYNPPDDDLKDKVQADKKTRAIVHRKAFQGVFQWEFGSSINYGDDVWDLIVARLPISLFYGACTLFLTYGLCIPLGILKALKHRTFVDNISSVIIFVGYAIPGYVLGLVLLYTFAFRFELFPLGGFTSDNFGNLSGFEKVFDVLYHAILPLFAYLAGSFAFDTMLMKNNLMDNLAADYVRTAVAKGAGFRASVLNHALRNSLIPIASTFGGNITLILGGSFLIESIFDIDGFGMLGLTSIVGSDYTVVMATIFLSSLLFLLGNIVSDLLVALVDPRIRYK